MDIVRVLLGSYKRTKGTQKPKNDLVAQTRDSLHSRPLMPEE